jgi:hypothetical protein
LEALSSPSVEEDILHPPPLLPLTMELRYGDRFSLGASMFILIIACSTVLLVAFACFVDCAVALLRFQALQLNLKHRSTNSNVPVIIGNRRGGAICDHNSQQNTSEAHNGKRRN